MKMAKPVCGLCFVIVLVLCNPVESIVLIVPEDVPTGLVGIYGFAPKIVKGNDARVGFGFRFGNHADLQLLYEIGPQAVAQPIQALQAVPIRSRSAAVSSTTFTVQKTKRRPLLDFLAGLFDVSYRFNVQTRESVGGQFGFDEPR